MKILMMLVVGTIVLTLIGCANELDEYNTEIRDDRQERNKIAMNSADPLAIDETQGDAKSFAFFGDGSINENILLPRACPGTLLDEKSKFELKTTLATCPPPVCDCSEIGRLSPTAQGYVEYWCGIGSYAIDGADLFSFLPAIHAIGQIAPQLGCHAATSHAALTCSQDSGSSACRLDEAARDCVCRATSDQIHECDSPVCSCAKSNFGAKMGHCLEQAGVVGGLFGSNCGDEVSFFTEFHHCAYRLSDREAARRAVLRK